MPEFLERRYDSRVRDHFALMSLFLIIFVDAAGIIYSGALVCRLIFPAWPLWLIVAALAAAAGLYTTLGGLRAVIYTEAVQAIVLLAGALHDIDQRVQPSGRLACGDGRRATRRRCR